MAASRRTSSAADWHQSTSRVRRPTLWTVSRRCRNSAPASAVSGVGKRQAEACAEPSGRSSLAPAQAAFGCSSSQRGSRAQLGVLVQQQRIATARALQQLRVVDRLAAPLLDGDRVVDGRMLARRPGRAVARTVVEHEDLRGERHACPLARHRVQPAQEQLAL